MAQSYTGGMWFVLGCVGASVTVGSAGLVCSLVKIRQKTQKNAESRNVDLRTRVPVLRTRVPLRISGSAVTNRGRKLYVGLLNNNRNRSSAEGGRIALFGHVGG